MKWNNKFNYPKSSRSIENGMRKYLFGDEKLPSVTSILQATKSEEDKAAIKNWVSRVGSTEANRIKNEASNRGTSMHSYIEDFLRGRINESFFESNEKYKNMAKEIIDKGIKGKLEEIYGIETTLHYPKKYAGASDLIAIYNGKPSIIDFKNSTQLRKDEWNFEYYLQLSAYQMAHNKVYGTDINQGVILVCTKDLMFQSFVIDSERLKNYQEIFLRKVDEYYKMQLNNK